MAHPAAAGLEVIPSASLRTGFEANVPLLLKYQRNLRQINAKYLGPMAQYTSTRGDSNSIRAALTAQIETEKDALLESTKLAADLTEKVSKAKSEGAGSIQLKLSILNRGNTDGLIRSVGEVSFPKEKVAFPIKRTAQKKSSPSGMMAMAVPVTVVNPVDDAQRSGAVGKVEKNSMVEFWFALDQDSLSPGKLTGAITLFSKTPTNPYEIVLFDHANQRVNFRRP
jgi:hypothetical protein